MLFSKTQYKFAFMKQLLRMVLNLKGCMNHFKCSLHDQHHVTLCFAKDVFFLAIS